MVGKMGEPSIDAGVTMSDVIKKLQRLLNGALHPSPHLKIDGHMGPKTRAAIAAYNKVKQQLSPKGDLKPIVANVGTVPQAQPAAGSDKWMAIAEAESGTYGIEGPVNNPRIVAYHQATSLAAQNDEVAWCSSFVNWVMKQAGYVGTNNALASSWMGWGKASEKVYGAIVVIKRIGASSDAATGSGTGSHVGFYCETRDNRIRLLGGNQGNAVNNMGFNLASYAVKAVRWPA